MRKLRWLSAVAAIAAALAVFAIGQLPASAHGVAVAHGNDTAGLSYVDHTLGFVCDNERDGHWVRATFYYPGGSTSEKDGGDADCDYTRVPADTYRVRICEEAKPNCFDIYHV